MPAKLAGWVLGVAVVLMVATFGVSLFRLDESADVANVVAAVVAAISAVVVAFFGIHVAEAGRKDAERARDRAQRLHLFEQGRSRRLAASSDDGERRAILREDPPEDV